MKISKLIEKLQEIAADYPEAEVYRGDYEYEIMHVQRVEVDKDNDVIIV